ncbi:AMP-dependent synthetase/ligase [Roseomonas sp. CCTCC AB2023176]|uniref:AMP-dependent synthetase/ligase n=1 Tax=Roseomonas sp. CCTCC AB2023176 TaxID=3342640 RepID=UPI0035D6D49F
MTFPPLTLPQMLREQARTRPDAVAIRQKDFGVWRPVTWRDYLDRAIAVGYGFRALGLAEGGHVAVIAENRLEWVLSQLGAGLVGAVTIGVYPTSPSNEVAYVLAHSEAEIVVCEDQEQVDKVLERRAELPRLRHIVVMETKGFGAYPPGAVTTFPALEEAGRQYREEHPTLVDDILARQDFSDLALMIYTSGSTGKPKGAMLSYRNLRGEAIAVASHYDWNAGSISLSYLPLCHVAEQALTSMTPIYAGSTVHFGESLRTVQEDLREVAPTHFLGVPRIWEKLHSSIHFKMMEAGGWRLRLFERAVAACEPFAEIPPARRTFAQRATFALSYALVFRALQNFIGLRRARVVLTGAAPIPPKIVHFFRTIGLPFLEAYGATETTAVASSQRLGDLVALCVGIPCAGVEIRLGEGGEVQVRGDTVFTGYYRAEEATRAAFTEDGWLRTGDVGEMVDGQLRIVDRLKDIIITAGGKNLSPSEIENTVKASPFIKECIVIGDGRAYVSALIQIDPETVGQWAEGQGIIFTTFRSLAEEPRVRELVAREVDKANAGLAPVSQVRRFRLLPKELDHDDDEVTATMKVRRANIAQKYADEIRSLYAPA